MSEEREDRTDTAQPATSQPVVQIGGGVQKPPSEPAAGADPETGRDPEAPDAVPAGAAGMINIRNISVKCGRCDTYQTLTSFSRRGDGWNVYTFECENDVCDPASTRTLIEVPEDLDEFARRDTGWRGGRIHAGGG